MGSSASAPPPPDTSAYERGAYSLAEASMAFAREQMAYGRKQQDRFNTMADDFLGFTMPAMEEQFAFARRLQERYETVFQPLEDQLIAEAERYNSPEEIAKQRGKAIQDVQTAAEAKRESAMRNLESYGVDPTQLRYQALDRQARTEEAGLAALAANNAEERTRDVGRRLRADAINVGTGVRGAGEAAYGAATDIGATGINAAYAAGAAGNNAGASAIPYLGAAGAGYSSASGIADSSYQNELGYAQDKRDAESNLGGLGDLAMTAAQAYWPVAADGGLINAPGGPTEDAGAIRISDGEYVIPAEVVTKLGALQLDKFVERSTQKPAPKEKQAVPVRGAI